MLRAYLYLAVFIPLTFLFSVSSFISTLFDGSGRAYAWHARLWGRLALGLAGVKVALSGAEHIPDGPVIFMSNHQSSFDILALLAAMPRRIHWIAKKELFDIPVFGQSMRRGGYIPLDRGDGRKALQSMDDAAATIRLGKSVVMFPEGTRTRGRPAAPLQTGWLHPGPQGGGAGYTGYNQRQRQGQSGRSDQVVQRRHHDCSASAGHRPWRPEKKRSRKLADGKRAERY